MTLRLQPQHPSQLTDTAAVRYVEDTLASPMRELHSFPKYIYVEPINYCNARCTMCPIDFDAEGRSTRHLPEPLFRKIVEEIAEYRGHVEKVMLYLDCEPMIDRRLHLKVRALKEAGVRVVNIATNGSLLNPARSAELIDAGLDEIYISVDSMDAKTYEEIRVGLHFGQVIENTRAFIRMRDARQPDLRIRIQAILHEQNCEEGESIQAHWAPLLSGDDEVAVQRAHNWAGAIDVMEFGDEEATNHIPCISLWGTFCIHVDGEVGLCTMDVNRDVSLGNVSQQSIAEIWAGAELERIRSSHLDGRRPELALCDGCTHWRECKRDLVEGTMQ